MAGWLGQLIANWPNWAIGLFAVVFFIIGSYVVYVYWVIGWGNSDAPLWFKRKKSHKLSKVVKK